jgi:glycosyltransferase involved in cell wall biosynthesis
LKVVVFDSPYSHVSGGTRRSYEVLRRLNKYGVKPIVVIDSGFAYGCLNLGPAVQCIKIRHMVNLKKSFQLKSLAMVLSDLDEIAREIAGRGELPDLVVSHSENPSFVLAACAVASKLDLPWTAVLQLPYGAFRLQTSQRFFLRKPLQFVLQVLSLKALSRTTVLPVSPAIPYEMGCRLDYISLDPGVGVDHEVIAASGDFGSLFDGVFYARLAPEKGVFDILHIWHYIVKKKPEARLAVIGKFVSESVKSRFHTLVKRLQLEKKVIHLGFLERKRLFAYVKSSKLLVYPSRVDAFPLVVLESLACGLPVVAYNIPAIQLNYPIDSVVKIPPGDVELAADAALDLLQNEQKRRRLSLSAVDFSRRFSWDLVAESEANAYAKILEGR